MPIILNVDSDVSNIPEFDSAGEAIAASIAERAKHAHKLTIRESLPAMIEKANYSLDRATFRVGGVDLNVFVSGSRIAFNFNRSDDRTDSPAATDYELIWQSGQRSAFRPEDSLRKCVSKSLADISLDSALNFYFQNGGGLLQFRPLWCNTRSRFVLYLYELEPIL